MKNKLLTAALLFSILLSGCSDSGDSSPAAVDNVDTWKDDSEYENQESNDTDNEEQLEDEESYSENPATEQPYFELSVSPEDLKIAGYTCLDGDHLNEVQQTMEQIIPEHQYGPGYGGSEDNTGWYYGGIDYSNNVWIYYSRSRNDHVARIEYGLGSDLAREEIGDKVRLCIECNIDMDYSELPDIPFLESNIPLNASYDEALDLLGLTELLNATDANGEKLTFESQYGTDCICWHHIDGAEDRWAIDVTTPEWSMQLGFEKNKLWRFFFWQQS